MCLTSFKFGHPIHSTYTGEGDFKDWVYDDTGGPLVNTRACPKCKQLCTPEGHDPCLGTLPGVRHACCGHGVTEGYVHFENGLVIRGWFNVET